MAAEESSGRPVITGVRRVGSDALLLETQCTSHVPAVAAAVRQHLAASDAPWSATDVVPAARTVLLTGLTSNVDMVARDIRAWDIAPLAAGAGPLVQVPVVFDGPDLGDVAQAWGITADAVIERLLHTQLRAAFSGFAPGFAYLTGLSASHAVPRRETPRTRVSAGAVGLAGRYCGIYPRVSPGGWQLVGRAVDTQLWDVDREPPALLIPGTRVALVAASTSAGT